jgi:DNA-binding NarL/FixJ family response regulator
MAKIRVLLADDHETIQQRVKAVLAGGDFEIVASVKNGRDAVVETQRLDPDVLVIDISMPEMDGLQAARQMQSRKLRTKIVFLTVHEDEDFVTAAFAAGASAYVTKARVTTDLLPAIHEALEGHKYVSASISM